MKTHHAFILLLALLGLVLLPTAGAAQDFPDVCQQSENILRNCNFDSGLDHWQTFLETGSANFGVLQGGGECHAPLCPAAHIVTEDHFVGGLYQQVPVQPGVNYYANIVWLVFDSLVNDQSIQNAVGKGIGRKVGIDPFGGTDPTSPNVVWSQDNWRNDCKICNIEYVVVTAQAETITVFLRLDDTWRLSAREKGLPVPPSKDQFWLDDLGLKPVGGEPIPVEQVEEAPPTDTPAPTATPVPPTDTPAPEADTPTPESAEPTPQPAETAPAPAADAEGEAGEAAAAVAQADIPAAAEPVSPVATPTPVATNTPPPPPPTLTPTNTPSPTPSREPRPSRTPQSVAVAGAPGAANTGLPAVESSTMLWGVAGTTICVGGLGLMMLAVVMVGLVYLYRLGWGQSPNDDDAGADLA